MNVTIKVLRGEIDFVSFDPAFQKRLEDHLIAEEADVPLLSADSTFLKLRRAHRELVRAVEEVLGEEGKKQPLTITLLVEGERFELPPGPALY